MAARLSTSSRRSEKSAKESATPRSASATPRCPRQPATAKKLVAEVEKQIQQDLVSEKAKVPAIVKSLTEEVYKLALA